MSPAPAPLACKLCAIAITRMVDAEPIKERGQRTGEYRCVDKMACHLRAIRARRRAIGLEEEKADAT